MEEPTIRINKVLRDLNISLGKAVNFLKSKNIVIIANTKIDDKTQWKIST